MDDEAKPEAQHAGGLHAEHTGGEPEIPDHAVAQLPSVCGKGHARRLSGRAGAARDAVVQLAHRAHPAAVAFPAGLYARADEPDAALPSQRCGGPDAQLDGGGLGAHRRDRARYLPDDGSQHERLCAGRCDAPAESNCKKPLHFGFSGYTGLRKCKLRFPGRRGKIRKQTERSAGTWNRTCWRESWQR